jgi:hypothetical protein
MDLTPIADLIDAARKARRTDPQVVSLLSAEELGLVLGTFIEACRGLYGSVLVQVSSPQAIQESGKKIEYIKIARNVCGMSLKDAKDFTEGMRAPMRNDQFALLSREFAPVGGLQILTA